MDNPEMQEQKTPPPLKAVDKAPALKKPTGRFQMFLRIALFSLGGALILFLAGAIVTYLVLTRPAQAELGRVSADWEDEKTASQQRIADLESRIEKLSSQEMINKELQQELDAAGLHIAILNTLTDVMTARIELAAKNEAGVRLALNNVSKSLATLEGLVQPDQQAAVMAMQDHLKLVMGEFVTNASAAESDLDVLTENLLQLRQTFLSSR